MPNEAKLIFSILSVGIVLFITFAILIGIAYHIARHSCFEKLTVLLDKLFTISVIIALVLFILLCASLLIYGIIGLTWFVELEDV